MNMASRNLLSQKFEVEQDCTMSFKTSATMIGDDAKVSCCKWRSIFINSLLAMGEGCLSTWPSFNLENGLKCCSSRISKWFDVEPSFLPQSISFHEYTDPRDGLLPKDALRPEGPKTYIAYGL